MVVRNGLPVCLLAVLLVSLAPTALAYSPDTNCAYVTDSSNYYVPTDYEDPEKVLAGNATGYHLRVTDTAVEAWVETNDLKGLQVARCVDNDGVARDKDTKDDEFEYAKHLVRREICERAGQDPDRCPDIPWPFGPLVPENGTQPVTNYTSLVGNAADNTTAFANTVLGIVLDAVFGAVGDPDNATTYVSGAVANATTAVNDYAAALGQTADDAVAQADNDTKFAQAAVNQAVADGLATVNQTRDDGMATLWNSTGTVNQTVEEGIDNATTTLWGHTDTVNQTAQNAQATVLENVTAAEQTVIGVVGDGLTAVGVIQNALLTFVDEVVNQGIPPEQAAQNLIDELSGLVPA